MELRALGAHSKYCSIKKTFCIQQHSTAETEVWLSNHYKFTLGTNPSSITH
jgi:hypothetical protein